MPRRSVGVGNRLRCERTYVRTYAVVGGAPSRLFADSIDVEIIN